VLRPGSLVRRGSRRLLDLGGTLAVTEAAGRINRPGGVPGAVGRRAGAAGAEPGPVDALGSADKTLHASPGKHGDLPRSEADSSLRFFALHLG
jgi:hypothetical protein